MCIVFFLSFNLLSCIFAIHGYFLFLSTLKGAAQMINRSIIRYRFLFFFYFLFFQFFFLMILFSFFVRFLFYLSVSKKPDQKKNRSDTKNYSQSAALYTRRERRREERERENNSKDNVYGRVFSSDLFFFVCPHTRPR